MAHNYPHDYEDYHFEEWVDLDELDHNLEEEFAEDMEEYYASQYDHDYNVIQEEF